MYPCTAASLPFPFDMADAPDAPDRATIVELLLSIGREAVERSDSMARLRNSAGFRDDEQRRRVQRGIHDRLADDRDQQECRFLMRFRLHLVMSYREVSMDELRLNAGRPKLDVVEALISAIRSSHADIDNWITTTQQVFPVIEGRGFRAAQDAAG